MSVLSEAKAALREARPSMLAHHPEEEYYKCYAIPLHGRRVRLCARCLGVYAGIVLGIVALVAHNFSPRSAFTALGVFPAFALADWSLAAFTSWQGSNPLRTLTGLLLGVAYVMGLHLLLGKPANLPALAVGAAYLLLAGALLAHTRVTRLYSDLRSLFLSLPKKHK